MRITARRASFMFVAILALGSHARAQCSPPTTLACAGKLQLDVITKPDGHGFLTMTRCPKPPCHTTTPATLTITDALGTTWVQSFNLQSISGSGCLTGSDRYSAAAGDRLKFIFGKAGTVLATHLRGVPQTLVGPVTVTVTDCKGYSVGATLSQCTPLASKIRCTP